MVYLVLSWKDNGKRRLIAWKKQGVVMATAVYLWSVIQHSCTVCRRHLEKLRLATESVEAELLSKQQLIEQTTTNGLWGASQCALACQSSGNDQQYLLECNIPSVSRSSTPVLKDCSLLDESTCESLLASNSMTSINNFCVTQLSDSAVQTTLVVSWSEEGIQTECLSNHAEIQTSGEWHNLQDEKLQIERERYAMHCICVSCVTHVSYRLEERAAFESQLNDLNMKVACFEEDLRKQQEQIQHLEKERDKLVQLNDQLRLDEEKQREGAERIQMKHMLDIDKLQLQHELEMTRMQRELISERRRQLQYAVPFYQNLHYLSLMECFQ